MFDPSLLSVRNQISPPLQASKWLTLPVLLEVQEMEQLLAHLGVFGIYVVSAPVGVGQGQLSKTNFLSCYQNYLTKLKEGEIPVQDSAWRTCFSSVWTASADVVYAFNINDERQLIKLQKPAIQLQPHKFDYSESDGKFRSMVFGLDSIVWGIQFSYPQIFQDEHMQIISIGENPEFPNTTLFKVLQKWMRQHTVATPFIVHGKRVNVPIRLGKQCFSWINQHPQLAKKGIQVVI